MSVWHRRELESLQVAALELAKSEGMEAEYADIDHVGTSIALSAGYCRLCNEYELGGERQGGSSNVPRSPGDGKAVSRRAAALLLNFYGPLKESKISISSISS